MDATVIIIPLIPVIIGLFYALYAHVSNVGRHPDKKDIVFRDVCKPEMKRLEDCAEREIKALKELMSQRFDNLERLVRNGGGPPKIRT
jgi:hypothetical protein